MKLKLDKIFRWKKKKDEIPEDKKASKRKNSSLIRKHRPSVEFNPIDYRRAVIAWLLKQNPTGIGVNVPTRISRFQAEIAAFWSSIGKKRLLHTVKTAIIEIRHNREQCWPDCSKHNELLRKLVEQKELKGNIETSIREKEPELRDSDTLFKEYESWKYSGTKNQDYHKCLKEIEKIEHSLYKGSRFERIRRAHVADNLYLAVPEGTIHENELADGWGLIVIKKNLFISLVKKSDDWECPEENRMHLVQNISSSAKKFVLYSHGIAETEIGKAMFTALPRRRRKKSEFLI